MKFLRLIVIGFVSTLVKGATILGSDNCLDCSLSVVTGGNSGAGKSLTDNLLCGRDAFVHAYSLESVTRLTEHSIENVNKQKLVIYNIPGLMEIDPDNVQKNKVEIETAFKGKPAQVFVYVFGTVGGRIMPDDISTFLAMQEAFDLKHHSTVFLFNRVPQMSIKENEDYEAQAELTLRKFLTWPENEKLRIVFGPDLTNEIATNTLYSSAVSLQFRMRLYGEIFACTPEKHTRVKPLLVDADRRKMMKVEMEAFKKTFEDMKVTHSKELEELKERQRADRAVTDQQIAGLQSALTDARNEARARGDKGCFSVNFMGFGVSVC